MNNEKTLILVTHGVMIKEHNWDTDSLEYRCFDNEFTKCKDKMLNKINKIEYLKGKVIIKDLKWSEFMDPTLEKLKEKYELGAKNHKKSYFFRKSIPGWSGLRLFLFDCFGYPIIYLLYKENNESLFEKINEKFLDELRKYAENLGENANLIIFAHSLGAIITYYFLTYLQESRKTPSFDESRTPLERGETLKFLYTSDNPLPFVSVLLTNPKFGKPIEVNKWVNFYNKNDYIAYPIGVFNEEYAKRSDNARKNKYPMIIDKKVFSGGILKGWNSMSHTCYFSDKKIIKTIVEDLQELYS